MNYEEAMAFVISIRPRMAVEDADAAANRLLLLASATDFEKAVADGDWVRAAQQTPAVMDEVRQGRKIQAIKELRTATGIGLKEATDAIEYPTIWTPEVQAMYESRWTLA